MRVTFIAVLVVLTGCGSATESTTTSSSLTTEATTTTVATTTTSAPTTTTTIPPTTTTTLGQPTLMEPDSIGIWPYRTASEALTAAANDADLDSAGILERFIVDRIGWTVTSVTEDFSGPTMVGYTIESSGGTVHAATRVVAHSASRQPVWAIDFASSLDFLEDGWGPSTDIGESEEGWSALIGATPIEKLISRPGVTGPYAQLSYGEWASDRVLLKGDVASVSIAVAPDTPGVLSIWYLNQDDSVAGFSMLALPPGPFVAG